MMATDGRHVWLTADGLLEMHDFSCCDLLEIFSDDLESTDATAWSGAVGAAGSLPLREGALP